MDEIIPIVAIVAPIIGLPWLLLHYITKWKQAPRITEEDERLLDELHIFARRMEERVQTVERIIAADNPDFRQLSAPTTTPRLEETGDYMISRRN